LIKIFVRLYVSDFVAFERFERNAIKILANYGGSLVEAFETKRSGSSGEEIHILEFPDRESFERYRHDPDLRNLSELREKAIFKTEVQESIAIKNYDQ